MPSVPTKASSGYSESSSSLLFCKNPRTHSPSDNTKAFWAFLHRLYVLFPWTLFQKIRYCQGNFYIFSAKAKPLSLFHKQLTKRLIICSEKSSSRNLIHSFFFPVTFRLTYHSAKIAVIIISHTHSRRSRYISIYRFYI